jgi:hypothetical protein
MAANADNERPALKTARIFMQQKDR